MHELRKFAFEFLLGLLTNHFLRSADRDEFVRVTRISKRGWSVFVPLPEEMRGTLSQFESSFGYPIDFVCECSTDSSGECSCSREAVLGFWRYVSAFLIDYASIVLDGVSIESLRRAFVKLYIDLPVNLERDRQRLIESVNTVYHTLVGDGKDLPWFDFLSGGSIEDAFTNDVSVLSILRGVIDQRTARVEVLNIGPIMPRTSPIVWLQLASVLDQMNMIDISVQVSHWYLKHSSNFVPDYKWMHRYRLSLSSKNPARGLIFPTSTAESPKVHSRKGLDDFRNKLSQMIMFKKGEIPDNDNSPMAIYSRARRGGQQSAQATHERSDRFAEPLDTHERPPANFSTHSPQSAQLQDRSLSVQPPYAHERQSTNISTHSPRPVQLHDRSLPVQPPYTHERPSRNFSTNSTRSVHSPRNERLSANQTDMVRLSDKAYMAGDRVDEPVADEKQAQSEYVLYKTFIHKCDSDDEPTERAAPPRAPPRIQAHASGDRLAEWERLAKADLDRILKLN